MLEFQTDDPSTLPQIKITSQLQPQIPKNPPKQQPVPQLIPNPSINHPQTTIISPNNTPNKPNLDRNAPNPPKPTLSTSNNDQNDKQNDDILYDFSPSPQLNETSIPSNKILTKKPIKNSYLAYFGEFRGSWPSGKLNDFPVVFIGFSDRGIQEIKK